MNRHKYFIAILFVICLIACKTASAQQITDGVFNKVYKYEFLNSVCNCKDELILNSDSTFFLTFMCIHINKCQGKWYYLDDITICLKCDEPDVFIHYKGISMPIDPSIVMTDYMRVRERQVKIVDENTIKLEMPESKYNEYIILKRVVEPLKTTQ
ncbi:MAG: hypothetical protein LBC68_03260 [Prevotellaceae bacterium]|jgi:hypothetical protein|nr:hypothetical protein [Prevotellaceae bacterium]